MRRLGDTILVLSNVVNNDLSRWFGGFTKLTLGLHLLQNRTRCLHVCKYLVPQSNPSSFQPLVTSSTTKTDQPFFH